MFSILSIVAFMSVFIPLAKRRRMRERKASFFQYQMTVPHTGFNTVILFLLKFQSYPLILPKTLQDPLYELLTERVRKTATDHRHR